MRYIALLRGINVGSKNRIKMADLKMLLESMDFKNVKTYLQSGNIIFDSNSSDVFKIAEDIKTNINKSFGFSIKVIIRTKDELENIVNNNPFIKNSHIQIDKLHITFLQDIFDKGNFSDLYAYKNENEKFRIIRSEIYLYLPEGYARTRLTNNFLENKLKAIATTRSWKTIVKLMELSKSN